MNPGIEIEILWVDSIDGIGLRVTGSNGRFAGAANLWLGHEAVVADLANELRGFPNSIGDQRDVLLGGATGFSGGEVKFQFRCVDRVGHAVVDVHIHSEPGDHWMTETRHPESADFTLPVEAGDVDRFVSRLTSMDVAAGEIAFLRQAS